jgi:hypothetical protein
MRSDLLQGQDPARESRPARALLEKRAFGQLRARARLVARVVGRGQPHKRLVFAAEGGFKLCGTLRIVVGARA